MLKISSILNTLFALILLGATIAMFLFGYSYFIASDDDGRSSTVNPSEDSTSNSVIGVIERSSNLVKKSEIDAPKSVITSILKPAPEPISQKVPQASVKPAAKKELISLYPDDSDKYPAFTTLEKDNGIIVYNSGSEWSHIISASGVPVWIRGDMVKSVGSGYIEVIIPRVNARSSPNTQTSAIIGSLSQGEILKVSRKRDGWFRVWSPVRFRAWVKTQDLESG